MTAPKAPVLDASGKKSKDLTLEASVFAVEVKPHLVHETVRGELNARRAGTRAAKSRGLVSGGRTKPWRQKGTGRARAGSTRAPQWTGGGAAFPPSPRNFGGKVNRKVRRAALRAALAAHAQGGTFAVLADDSFGETPSTRQAAELLAEATLEFPLLVVAEGDQEALVKSFRNLAGVFLVTSAETEVAELVWAKSVLVSETALRNLEGRAK
jgi:large subunit ribosomal protein L4